MNFLAHCLIAAKAGASHAIVRPTGQTAGRPTTGHGANPPTKTLAKRPSISALGSDLIPSTSASRKAGGPFPTRPTPGPSAARLANGTGEIVGLHGGLIAGGLLGDFVKGQVPPAWPSALQWGVRLHRRIDAYSNTLPGIRQSCARFPAELRRFAPIFIDIIADHCLALDWADHHRDELKAFSAQCYALAAAQAHRLNGEGRRYLSWLIDQDLMSSYLNQSVMERGLLSITRRLARQHLNASLLNFMAGALPSLHADFRGYFPLLVKHGQQWVRDGLQNHLAEPAAGQVRGGAAASAGERGNA